MSTYNIPHFKPRPVGGPLQPRSKAPLVSELLPSDTPAVPDSDLLHLDLPEMPVRRDKPDVPNMGRSQMRPRVAKARRMPLMGTLSVKNHRVNPVDIAKHLFS